MMSSTVLRPTCTFTMTGHRKEVQFSSQGHGHFYGFNRKLIDADGNLLAHEAIKQQAGQYWDRYMVGRDLGEDIRSYFSRDSHTQHIYAMLTTWLYSYVYECSHKGSFCVTDANSDEAIMTVPMLVQGYESSHHIVSAMNGSAASYMLEAKVKLPFNHPDNNFNFVDRSKDNFMKNNYVIALPDMDELGMAFILGHVGGREGNDVVNFDIPLPPVQLGYIAVDTKSPHLDRICSLINSTRIFSNSDKLMGWIVRYVEHNRLHWDFTVAIEMLTRLALQPVAHSMESMWWQQGLKTVVSMPVYCPTRALLRPNLEGEPYFVHSDLRTVMFETQNSIADILTCSAISNYAVKYGMYALLDDETQSVRDWRQVMTGGEVVSTVLDNYLAYINVLNNITSYNVETAFDGELGMSYDLSEMTSFQVTQVKHLEGREAGNWGVFKIDRLVAPVSGCLLDGVVSARFRVTKHLASTMIIEGLDNNTTNYVTREDALGRAQAFRYLNCDTSWSLPYSDETYLMWASVHDWMVEPSSVINYKDDRMVELRAPITRNSCAKHCGVPAPDLLFYEDITIVKGRARLSFCVNNSNKPAIEIIQRKLVKPIPLTIAVPRNGQITTVRYSPKYHESTYPSGFIDAPDDHVARYLNR
ncbi:MAG: hypothetical protein SOMTV1_gp1 [Sanya ochthera mantis totivirus 1]|nr:MAG: hypothetical protein SOMTV1_gp1 [Sanya ochthera mantis totivirus 1]